jgi:hypothetical protein
MAIHTAVIYGSARRGRQGVKAKLGAPSIPSAFPISRVHASFDDDGNAVDESYDKRIGRFLDEYEWYANALKAARMKETCDTTTPVQQGLCRGEQ